MADIQAEIEKISTAVYGEEVRDAIVNSLTEINNQKPDDEDVIKNEDGAVASDNIASGAVTLGKIAEGAILPNNFVAGAVNERAMAVGAVSTKKIVDGAVTKEKLSESLQNELADKVDNITYTAGLKEKQNVQYLTNTVTTVDDFVAYNQTNTVYTGRMQGFATKFGESSDGTVKGFRMWFVLSGSDNPTWYRVILFDDGTIWTATRSSTRFTQVSYSKKQIDNLFNGIDTTNIERLSDSVSSAEQLNDCTDMEKTYLFNVVPPLALNLPVTVGTPCILNSYDNLIQILKTVRFENRTFIREYNSSTDIWNEFTDITIPDNYIIKAKLSTDLSAEIGGKYDSSNIETGSGEFTTTSVRISSANFEYQKVGDYVTVNIFASFAESSMGATTSIQLTGMPFVNESSGTLRLPCSTSKKTGLIVALGKNTINILTPEAVTFSADETMGITITYKITKTNGG